MKQLLMLVLSSVGISPLVADSVQVAGTWTLQSSELVYTVNHPLKTSVGKSTKARGKVRCAASCEFLIAVPVVSFDSGDSNRDLHMLETTKGATFPVITVRGNFPGGSVASPLKVDFLIEFAGQKASVPGVSLSLAAKGDKLEAAGSFKLQLSQFGVVKPALLGMAIDDDVAITIQSLWESAK